MNLSQINTNCIEGRLLIAAIGELTIDPDAEVTAQIEEVLIRLQSKVDHICDIPLPEPLIDDSTFEERIRKAINTRSMENGSNTPDFILAKYLVACLVAFNEASRSREAWYGQVLKII